MLYAAEANPACTAVVATNVAGAATLKAMFWPVLDTMRSDVAPVRSASGLKSKPTTSLPSWAFGASKAPMKVAAPPVVSE